MITGDIAFESPLRVKKGQDITLVDKGQEVVLSAKPEAKLKNMIQVDAGGKLTIRTSTEGEDSLLSFNGQGFDPSSGEDMSGMFMETHGTLLLEGGTYGGAHVRGSLSGVICAEGKDAHLELNGGVVRDNSVDVNGWFSGVIQVHEGAHFEMNGGTITNNIASYVPENGGNTAIVFVDGEHGPSEFVMRDGLITENSAYFGGVFVGSMYYWTISDYEATFTMEGGTISNNTGVLGGGVLSMKNGNFYMKDGLITGNKASYGGGVSTNCLYLEAGAQDTMSVKDWSGEKGHAPARFVMTGGTITENTATQVGGGVYIASDTCLIEGGEITDNEAYEQGGGIYVGTVPYTLRIKNALVTDNVATVLGGGMWYCPTGDAYNAVTNGGAVFGNRTEGANTAGDDVVVIMPDAGVPKGWGRFMAQRHYRNVWLDCQLDRSSVQLDVSGPAGVRRLVSAHERYLKDARHADMPVMVGKWSSSLPVSDSQMTPEGRIALERVYTSEQVRTYEKCPAWFFNTWKTSGKLAAWAARVALATFERTLIV